MSDPPSAPPQRPPWAVAEVRFLDLCSQCDACVEACEVGLLQRGADGRPFAAIGEVECSFCTGCAAVCTTGAIHYDESVRPWDVVVEVSAAACLTRVAVACRTCADACPERAIGPGCVIAGLAVPPSVSLEACNGCGACLPVCPTAAISLVRGVAGGLVDHHSAA